MTVDVETVRAALTDYLGALKAGYDVGVVVALDDDADMLFDGMIDSLGLLGLMAALRERFGEQIDFEDLSPEEFTIVGPLCRYVAARANLV